MDDSKFRVEGATKLIQLYEAGKLTEEEIKGISDLCDYCGHEYKDERTCSKDPKNYVYKRNADEIRNIAANEMPANKEVNAAAGKLILLEVDPKNKSWDAGNLCTVTFKDGSRVELYQQDWYILDLHFVPILKSVILINGKRAKRWFKGSLEAKSYDLRVVEQFNRFKKDLKNDLQ